MSEWSFRYDGAPGGAQAALDASAVPESVAALVTAEVRETAARSTEVLIVARGLEVDRAEQAAADRAAAKKVPCSVQSGVDRTCQNKTKGCTVDHDGAAGTGPKSTLRELSLTIAFR
jgi:hypothetical protein